MKRYYVDWHMEEEYESDNGKYVLYEDAVAEIAALKVENEKLGRELTDYAQVVNSLEAENNTLKNENSVLKSHYANMNNAANTIAALRVELANAIGILKELEWNDDWICEMCRQYKPNHASDCRLAVVLKKGA